MRKFYIVVIVVLILISAGAFVLYMNSYSFALYRAGFNTQNVTSMDMGIDDNGREYCVIESHETGQQVKFAYLVKSSIGIWSVSYTKDNPSPETGLTAIGWMKTAGVKHFSADQIRFSSLRFIISIMVTTLLS